MRQEGTLGKSRYRLCLDFRALNTILLAPTKTILPSLPDIRSFCRHKILTSLDLKDMFFSIPLSSAAQNLTNFYFRNNIYKMKRLSMGIASSPWFGMHAMRLCFNKDAYLKWKQALPSDTKFHFQDPSQFLIFYMDDILIASPEDLGLELHLLCLD